MNVLVVGGASHIGSHCARQLQLAGHRPVVLDNLVFGHREAVSPEVPESLPIAETFPQFPINPYGQTKLDVENCLKALASAYGLSFAAVASVTGLQVPITEGDRRKGDPPSLYADPAKAKQELGWGLKYPDIHSIVERHRTHPAGFQDSCRV